MKNLRIGLNGMGRIGRNVLREWYDRFVQNNETPDLNVEFVAINNPGTPPTYTHLLKYDTTHGIFPAEIKYCDQKLYMGEKVLHFFNERDPSNINWSEYNVDLVIDATGKFKTGEQLSKHLSGTVKKVLMCAPGKDVDHTIVMGINEDTYNPEKHHILSNASCTTNCLAPIVKVLNDNFGIKSGHMITVHAYTLDQSLLDSAHKDLRRARAAAQSMIPTTTGAAKAVKLVLPELGDKLSGYAVRVPTLDVSLIELSATFNKTVSKNDINQAMLEASQSTMKGILGVNELPLVSSDFTGRRESTIFDATLTDLNGELASITAWYDNEVGFSNRVIDLAVYVGKKAV